MTQPRDLPGITAAKYPRMGSALTGGIVYIDRRRKYESVTFQKPGYGSKIKREGNTEYIHIPGESNWVWARTAGQKTQSTGNARESLRLWQDSWQLKAYTRPKLGGKKMRNTKSPIKEVVKNVRQENEEQITRAVVVANVGNQVELKRMGASDKDPTSWPKLSGVTVVVGDEVLIVKTGGGFIVIGKVLR